MGLLGYTSDSEPALPGSIRSPRIIADTGFAP